MYKKGQGNGGGILAWVAVAALVLFTLSYLGIYTPKLGAVAPTTTETAVSGTTSPESCPDSSATMTVGPAQVWRSTTTSLSNEYHRVYVGGIDSGLFRDSATTSVKVRDGTGNSNEIVVYYAENSTDRYAAEAKFTAACGAFTSASLSKNRYILANDTSAGLTFNIFNQNNGNLNAITDNVTITSGEEVRMRNDWFGRTDQAFAPYGSVIATVDYNDSEFDGGFISLGSNLVTSTPISHVPVNYATNFKSKSWKIPGGPDPSALVGTSGRWTFKDDMILKADAAVDPTSQNSRSFVNLTLCPENWYKDIDSGKELLGVEDARGTYQGMPCASTVIYYR